MSRIHLLDDEAINQIAAGEVVDRPASVIKELMENAIDAGASTVRVDLSSDSREITRIRVVDNGSGMEAADACLAFTRHATSKLKSGRDLTHISTMGFRGEALASIAAISRVTLVTKARDSEEVAGTRVVIAGGEVLESTETGAPEGTSIAVEDIFFNTPARRKFLRSRQTELTHIYGVAEHLALANPEVSFRLFHNGKEKISARKAKDLRETIGYLRGSASARDLLPMKSQTPYMQISGYLAKPQTSQTNSHQIYIAVNRRPVTSSQIARAVRDGYGTLLPKNRFPVAYVGLTIDLAQVDVNVHPTKMEIRFSDEGAVTAAISSAVREALSGQDLSAEGEAPLSRPAPFPEQKDEKKEEIPSTPGVASTEVAYRPASQHFRLSATDTQLRLSEIPEEEEIRNLPEMEVLGQVDETYIIAKTRGNEELVVIDQHAAHERILYDQLCRRRDTEEGRSQELLVPVPVTLRPEQAAALAGALPLLKAEGFVLEEFGRETYAVRAVPMVLGKRMGTEILEDMISDLLAEDMRSANERQEKITSTIACRAAIKAGATLSREQMTRLLDQLSRTEHPYTCPHGRPTIVTYTRARLDLIFRRT